MRLRKQLLLFCLGGGAYVGLEMLWRGRSHISMFLAGGGCFLLVGRLKKGLPLPFRAALGAVIITVIEFLTGILFNRRYQVWDYRELPLNFMGQVCLPFTLLWAPLSIFAAWLYRKADQRLTLRK